MMNPQKIQLGVGFLLSACVGIWIGYFSGDIQLVMVKHLIQTHPQVSIKTPTPEEARNWAWGLWAAALVLLPFLPEKPHHFREAVLPMALNLTCAFAYMCLQRWTQDVKIDAILLSQPKARIEFPFDSFNTDTYPVKWFILLTVLGYFFRQSRPKKSPYDKLRLESGDGERDSHPKNSPRRTRK